MEVDGQLRMLSDQQQGTAANLPVAQLVVLERGGWNAQQVGELRPAEAKAFPQLAQALAALVIELGDGFVALRGRFFHVRAFWW